MDILVSQNHQHFVINMRPPPHTHTHTHTHTHAPQEWQLRLSGIELGTGDTEATLVSEEEQEEELGGLYNRKPIGAINPLLMHGDTGRWQETKHRSHCSNILVERQ